MPIPAPILDDRSYQQLRDELVRRIPVYTPEWTDHNASDPGITLIELFAFLGENLLFRFNQIPETTRLAFLRLLQIPLRPASPARALLALSTRLAPGVLVEQGTEARAGALPFETSTEVHVWAVDAIAVGRIAAAPPDPSQEPEAEEFALRAIDAMGGIAEGHTAAYYQNQTVPTEEGLPPVDFDATVDGMLWVAITANAAVDRAALLDEMNNNGGAIVNLGFVPDAAPPSIDEVAACPGANSSATGAAVEWQVSSGEIDLSGTPRYRAIEVEGDTTRGLQQQGVVRLRLPADEFGPFEPEDADLKGTADYPPALDEETEATIVCWLRAFRHNGSRFGKVRMVSVNATEAMQARQARPEFVGTGNGQPDQTFRLANKPVLERSLVLEVEQDGAWRRWTETDSFHASSADDRHFVVDREGGEVRFGSGVLGAAPQIGNRIRAVEYRYGGGAAGNVASKAISKLQGLSGVEVLNPLPAFGGSETEPIEAALERIPGELRRRDRAVTAGDFQELALATPGANVGRAECLPRFHPPTRTPERPGIVTVVVWPSEDKSNPNAPLPDRNVLRAVCEWLDQRRLVTTELYVIPPTYRRIAVSVGLAVKPGYGIEAVRRWVELVLRQYLAPLPPYGPEGKGWPLGRRVHGPELEAAALQVEGVEFLEDLRVAGWREDTGQWVPGSVELEIYEVPDLAELTVVEGVPPAPGDAVPVPPTDLIPIPVPVIRQEC